MRYSAGMAPGGRRSPYRSRVAAPWATRTSCIHFNGKRWSRVSTPQPGGTAAGDSNELVDSYCVSASRCFAAGLVEGRTQNPKNQVLSWDGGKWSVVSVPEPAGTTPGDTGMPGLYGIHCVSASSCWAVGATHLGNNPFLNQVLRLRGGKWSRVTARAARQ